MEIQFVKPQTRTHLNKVLKRRVFKRSKVLSYSSKVHVLRSVQTSHIKHAGTIFHMVDRCFPNQFLQGKRRELTVFGDTQWIPNTLRIALHNARENLQWSRRWSIVFPSQQHKQHLLIKDWPLLTRLSDWPLLTRLSIMSILSLAVVHKKKDTYLGTFAHQIHFQGKPHWEDQTTTYSKSTHQTPTS